MLSHKISFGKRLYLLKGGGNLGLDLCDHSITYFPQNTPKF